ncbi:MAG: DUF362 domain-containing protein [Promethearchaeota archaeon]
MKTKQKARVSIFKFEKKFESLKKALELCGALDDFENLNKNAKILIKPNIVAWMEEIKMPVFGVLTTIRIIEDLLLILKNFGIQNIWIGEGGVELEKSNGKNMEENPFKSEKLGYKKLAEKYGVELIDFNKSKTKTIKIEDDNHSFSLKLAEDALNADYFINIPVLKTHSQTKVSLGIKNLKGCLKTSSKKFCHDANLNLEYYIQFLPDIIKPNLTIIDGIYALERGPLYFGKPYRKNLIIASKDVFAADLVGAKILGYNLDEINYLKYYASRLKKPKNLADYEILGEKIEENIQKLEWDWKWNESNTGPSVFDKIGIKNIAIPKYDASLCSGCSPVVNMVNIFVLSVNKKGALPKIEILNGKRMQARKGFEKTVLIGNCIIKANKANKNINQSIKIAGCPPSEEQIIYGLKEAGLELDESAYRDYLIKLSKKYENNPEFDYSMFEL